MNNVYANFIITSGQSAVTGDFDSKFSILE